MDIPRTVSHSGDIGDLVAALSTLKSLGTGWKLTLFPADCTGRRMTPERADSLRPLLEAQAYVSSAGWAPHPAGFNLDAWRDRYDGSLNLADMTAAAFGVPHYPRERPWITVPSVNRAARVVMGRSPRYQEAHFTHVWKRAWGEYRREAVFVGTPDEHADFCRDVGRIPYLPTKDHLELAQVIAGAELCLFNQTGNFWLAEALKARVVLESCHWCQNCHFERWGLTYGTGTRTRLPARAELRNEWRTNMARKAEDRTLLGEDRLKVIAELARQTERLPGAMAECGTFRGGSAKVIASVCPSRPLYLFDTFAGLPADETLAGIHRAGEFAADRAEVEAFVDAPDVRIRPGTFPATAAGLEGETFSFVHLDMDLYEPTLDALRFFWERMPPGGAIVLDDVDWRPTPGVNRAVEEMGLAGRLERRAPQQGVLLKPA